jgi:hypothetical protein
MTDDINLLLDNFGVVQREFGDLLRNNRSTIDATILGLRDVTRNLALHRHDLAETLCTLPAGVAPYDMTSSWGEWFNVRIVQFTFKDQQSKIVSSSSEEAGAGGKVDEPFVCSREQRKGRAPDAAATGAPTVGVTSTSGGLAPWIDSVISDEGTA